MCIECRKTEKGKALWEAVDQTKQALEAAGASPELARVVRTYTISGPPQRNNHRRDAAIDYVNAFREAREFHNKLVMNVIAEGMKAGGVAYIHADERRDDV